MQNKLRIGVIGVGMGSHHIEQFKKIPECEVLAVADTDRARLAAAADKYAIEGRFPSAEEMLAKVSLDAVVVATPNKFHAPLTIAALGKGLHVLCEKPMAMNVTEAEAMEAAADAANRTLMINLSYRFSNMSYALKQQAEAGIVGPIYFGRTVWHRRRGLPRFGGWFGQRELSGGGPLIDLGVHRIDLALWLMGHPEPAAVYGVTYDRIAQRLAAEEKKDYSVEDLACGLVRFRNGATLEVEASWAVQINEPEQMITALYGERGAIVQKNVGGGYEMRAEVYVEEGGNFYTKVLDAATTPAPSAQQEFVRSILDQRPPVATAADGIRVQKILNGLYRSAAEKREITF